MRLLSRIISCAFEEKVVSKTILLIGGTSSGKTHFGAQLLSRLQTRTGRLQLREAPKNVALFEATLQRLGQGLSSDHTESGLYGEVVLPAVGKSGQTVDLVWPDYAGEQLTGERGIAEVRTVPAHWMNRIALSDHWILMVRPMSATTEEDLLNRPLHSDPALSSNKKQHPVFSAQSQLIELLQILRHVKGVNNLTPARIPRMLVLLSCWDELPVQSAPPNEILADRLPMLHAFLKANWLADSLLIYGLSSLGKSLSSLKADTEYRNHGPESFGFVVLPRGEQVLDLTLPVANLAQ